MYFWDVLFWLLNGRCTLNYLNYLVMLYPSPLSSPWKHYQDDSKSTIILFEQSLPDKNPAFLKSFALNIWLYLSLCAGVIVPYGPGAGPKPPVSEFVRWTLPKPGPKLVWSWFPGPLSNDAFEEAVLNPLLIPMFNELEREVDGRVADEDGPNDEPKTEEEEVGTALVCGGDWFTPDQEILDVTDLCGMVIMPTLEKPLDTCGFPDWLQSVVGLVFWPTRKVLGMEVILRLLGSDVGSSIPFSLLWIRCTAMVNSCMVILPSRSMSARFLNNTTNNKTTVTESNSKQIGNTLYKQVICNPKRLKSCLHWNPNISTLSLTCIWRKYKHF